MGITQVQFATMSYSNASLGTGTFENYTAAVTAPDVFPGMTYTLKVTLGPSYDQWIVAWIDYNGDGDYADAGETVVSSTTYLAYSNTHSFNITIPAGAKTGTTRLRVSSQYYYYASTTNSCGPQYYGDVEDYNIRIMALSGFDCALTKLVAPATFGVGNNTIVARFTNMKKDTIKWLNLGYQLDNLTPVLVNKFDNAGTLKLSAGQSYDYTFATAMNIATKGNHTLKIWVGKVNDSIPDNDKSNDTLRLNFCTAMGGTYTIGATASDYPSVNAAVTDLAKCGIYAPVTFNIKDGTYTGKITIPEILGSSATNTITFDGKDYTKVKLTYNGPSNTDRATILLNGAKYLTFKNIYIEGTNTNYAAGVMMMNKANYNNFYNCKITVPNYTSSYLQPVVATSTEGSPQGYADNANFNIFTKCIIEGGYYGVSLVGTSSNVYSSGNQFISCSLANHYYTGFYLYYMGETTIQLCKIIVNTQYTSSYGIYSYYTRHTNIDANVINAGQYGIYLYMDNYYFTGDSSKITNNIIDKFSNTSYNNGIYAYYNYNQRILNNTISVKGSYAGSYSYSAILVYYGYANWIYNNILISSGNNLLLAFYPYPYTEAKVNYNIYLYSGAGNMFYSNGLYYSDLVGWKSSTQGLVLNHDNNSYENLQVGFVSSTDLHLAATYNPKMGKLFGLVNDVDGPNRCPYETAIGADESSYPVIKPKSSFYTADTVCHSSPVTFINRAPKSANQGYWWYLNGVLQAKTYNFTYTFPSGKQFDTIALVTANCGGRDTFTKIVLVDDPKRGPIADFVSDLNVAETYYPVAFSDISTFCPDTWEWQVKPAFIYNPSFGYVSTHSFIVPTNKASRNPVISFDYPGVYEVCLKVSNVKDSSKVCKPKYVTVIPSQWMCLYVFPEVSAALKGYLFDDGGPTSAYSTGVKNCSMMLNPCAAAVDITFSQFEVGTGDYLRIYEGKTNLGKPLWDVAAYGTNGLTGNMTNPAFKTTYSSKTGEMFIQWVTDAATVGNGYIATWEAKGGAFPAPDAKFDCPDTICFGTEVTFENLSTHMAGSTYDWDFTNSGFTESNAENPTYKFMFSGTYDVRLVVGDCGGMDTFYKKVEVIQPSAAPKTDFIADLTHPVAGVDMVTLSDMSVGCADKYSWSITPNTFSNVSGYPNGKVVKVKFNSKGCYDIKLISEYGGFKDSLEKICYINAITYCNPTADNLNADIGISEVALGTIHNSTAIGKEAYTDYTATNSTYLDVEATEVLTLERNTNFNNIDRKAWIDWNQDGDFDDAGELLGHEQNGKGLSWSKSFKVPANAELGGTRLRVSGVLSGTANNACGSRLFGEVEDYRVFVRPDGTGPVITLLGNDTITIAQCDTYKEDGATAMDNIDGNVSWKIKIATNLDVNTEGSYYVTYNVSDTMGNKAKEVKRLVIVTKDITPPVITLKGNAVNYHEVYNSFVDPGYTATDNCAGIKTVDIVSTLDANTLGTYSILYTAYDKAGNTSSVTRTITVGDTTNPIINLLGYATYDIEVHHAFTDLGVTITDNYCSVNPLSIIGTIDIHKLGSYTIIYRTKDCNGNGPVEVQRIVNVVDTTKPVIVSAPYKMGDEIVMNVKHNIADYLPMMTNSDNYDKGLTGNWFGEFYINYPTGVPTTIGTYKAEYEVTDLSGNKSITYFMIKVVDLDAPVITLTDATPLVKICRWKEVAPAMLTATATDNYDASVSVVVSGSYNDSYLGPRYEGFYAIRFNATDVAGNKAKELVRYVDVVYCETSIADGNDDSRINIYPNPTSGMFTLTLDLPVSANLSVSVLNTLGEVIKTVNEGISTGGNYQFDLSDFSSGIYFVRIQTGSEVIVKQITVSK